MFPRDFQCYQTKFRFIYSIHSKSFHGFYTTLYEGSKSGLKCNQHSHTVSSHLPFDFSQFWIKLNWVHVPTSSPRRTIISKSLKYIHWNLFHHKSKLRIITSCCRSELNYMRIFRFLWVRHCFWNKIHDKCRSFQLLFSPQIFLRICKVCSNYFSTLVHSG